MSKHNPREIRLRYSFPYGDVKRCIDAYPTIEWAQPADWSGARSVAAIASRMIQELCPLDTEDAEPGEIQILKPVGWVTLILPRDVRSLFRDISADFDSPALQLLLRDGIVDRIYEEINR